MGMTIEEFEEYAKAHNILIMTKEFYENRLKADMVAMLEDLRLDVQEAELAGVLDNKELIFADEADYLIQQKINALKEREDGTENADQGYKS